MRLTEGGTAVVTGAASGIGRALAECFAGRGLRVVMADVEPAALETAAAAVSATGAEVLAVPTDVSDVAQVEALAAAAFDGSGPVQVVCNNAGVAARADPWTGALASWEWVMGVNFWGVVHGVRAFLPRLVAQGSGHIVNTASVAGLLPGLHPSYDASKHAVVAVTEDLYLAVRSAGLPVGVSVLCPGWVRTGIADAERNWPDRLGTRPEPSATTAVTDPHLQRVIAEGMAPVAVADLVAAAVEDDRYWVFTDERFTEAALRRWHSVAEGQDPDLDREVPGMPTRSQLVAEMRRLA